MLDALSTAFDTIDNAGLAAEQACEQESFASGYEYGGVLLEREGRFYYTVAQTSHMPTHIDLRVHFTGDYHLVGAYHTHPGSRPTDAWFSNEDTRVASALHLQASYIGIQYEHGAVRRFTPGITHIEIRSGIALGDLVK